MLCCTDCNIETESTLTTVVFLNPPPTQLHNKLHQYAEKHQKRMHLKKQLEQSPTPPSNHKQNMLQLD